jgi:phospholipid transport system substrate-binding protein
MHSAALLFGLEQTMTGFRFFTRWTARSILALGLALTVLAGGPARAEEATATVRGFYDALLSTMKEGQNLGAKGRFEKLEPVIRKSFDLPYMARMTIGPEWAKFTDAQKQEMTLAFGRYITAQYANNFDSYSGEKLNVHAEQASSYGRVVQTQITPPDADAVAINYLLRQEGDSWRISDVYLGGTISELSVRRSEFVSILRRDGIEGLIRTLNRKADVLVASAQS